MGHAWSGLRRATVAIERPGEALRISGECDSPLRVALRESLRAPSQGAVLALRLIKIKFFSKLLTEGRTMTERPVGPRRFRFRMMFAIGATVSALMMGISGSTSLTAKADAACVSGMPCAWTGANYTGSLASLVCSSIGHFGAHRSAKNRCPGQNIRMGWWNGSYINWKFCMSPGGNRPNPGRFNYIGVC